ncbi:MAG: repair protein RadC [Parcubacteria group bacterium]|nr:repair protein RadC [Parcubacteria group bacterium]
MPVSPYVIQDRTLVMGSNKERRYTLKINDLPSEERPRERLLENGPQALSTTELLAILLSAGTKKEEVMLMSSRIMKDYGEKSIMRQTDADALAKELDIPIGKAMQIVACAELGRRFFEKNATAAPTIRTASDVYDYTTDMRSLSKEHLRGLYLNGHYKVIHDEVLSIGTIDTNLIHPREVFRPALEYAAAAIILVHNHPSGVSEASPADVAVTEQLIEAGSMLGIDLIDHVIVTKDSYASVPASYVAQ